MTGLAIENGVILQQQALVESHNYTLLRMLSFFLMPWQSAEIKDGHANIPSRSYSWST